MDFSKLVLKLNKTNSILLGSIIVLLFMMTYMMCGCSKTNTGLAGDLIQDAASIGTEVIQDIEKESTPVVPSTQEASTPAATK
jgi:hypothetical protein